MGGKRLKNPARNKDFTDIEIEILSRNPNVKQMAPDEYYIYKTTGNKPY
ncbi:hypothetical protein [Lacrimispora sp.]|nr:hypothetical protein [Lacrimispora sp.]